MDLLGQGIYGLSEVARFTGTNVTRIRPWFLHRSHRPDPLIGGVDRPVGGQPYYVTFHGLIDALVVSRLRDQYSLKMSYLRKVHNRLIEEFQVPHPFSRKDFLTDGQRIFVSYQDECGDETLKDVLSKQQAFSKILHGYLQNIDYDDATLLASRWRIAPGITLDPNRRYGKPIVESVGIPTGILAACYRANQNSIKAVSRWYDISTGDVQQAIAFEKKWGILAA